MTKVQTEIAWAILLMEIIFAAAFYLRQNKFAKERAVGGPISIPKSLWLSGAIFFWFFYPLIYALDPSVSLAWKLVLGFHLLSWWIRGPLEVFMIYRWFNWSPRYGIRHDLSHILALALGTLLVFISRNDDFHSHNGRALILVMPLVICIAGETL